MLHSKITAFPVVMILKNFKFLKTVILKLHYWCLPQRLILVSETIVWDRNSSRTEDWENFKLNLATTLPNLKNDTMTLLNKCVIVSPKTWFLLCFNQDLFEDFFVDSLLNAIKSDFQVNTPELIQVKVYLN